VRVRTVLNRVAPWVFKADVAGGCGCTRPPGSKMPMYAGRRLPTLARVALPSGAFSVAATAGVGQDRRGTGEARARASRARAGC